MIGFRPAIAPDMPIVYGFIVARSANWHRLGSQVNHARPFGWQGPDGGSRQIAEPFTWGWLGSGIVYEARTSAVPGIDLVAATDNVATIGVIAAGAEVWAVRDGGTPGRVFFTHVVHNGVWSVVLPQTP